MSSLYPGALDSLPKPTNANNLDDSGFEHDLVHDGVAYAVEAVQSTLGVNPQGSSATVKARLDALDTTVSGKITAGAAAIVDADVSASAAIAKSKLALTGAIVNADISASAAIALSKLATDPLARANHTGTQLAATISDFATTVASTAALKANNLSDLASATTARTNLGLGTAATSASTAFVSTVGGSTITASGVSVIPLVAKGAASQSANLQEWQNSATTVLAAVTKDGNVKIGPGGSGYLDLPIVSSYLGNTGTGFVALLSTNSASNIPLMVQGAALQTANLQEWRNSSNAILASISAAGVFSGTIDGGGA